MRGAGWLGVVTRVAGAALLVGLLAAGRAEAQATGFQLNRYEPTPPGEGTLAVSHPWYSGTRSLAAGLTFNYAHAPLVYGIRTGGAFQPQQVVIAHQLLMHVDVAGSVWDRLTLAASLPVVLRETGQELRGVGPVSGAVVGDLRVSALVRLWQQPDRALVSLSAGLDVWFPVGANDRLAGDADMRVLPKLVLAGRWRRARYSALLGYYHRGDANLGGQGVNLIGSTIGPGLQLGAALAYADPAGRFGVGPELLLNTMVVGGHALQKDFTNLELLLGGHYVVARQVQIGLGVGMGALRDPGTPDVRALLRVAWAPQARPQ